MGDMINIVLDTIGGDNGPAVCVSGAVTGLNKNPDVKLYLTGHKDELEKYLSEYEYDKNRLEVIDCTEEISLNEAPVQAVREKKDSSLVVGMNIVKGITTELISVAASAAGATVAKMCMAIPQPYGAIIAGLAYLTIAGGITIAGNAGTQMIYQALEKAWYSVPSR